MSTTPQVAYLGIDPATTAGVCLIAPNGLRYSGTVKDALRTREYPIVRDVLLAIPAGVKVVCAIEKPPSGLRGSAIPRWLGDRYEEMVRAAYPRRVQVLRPTPTKWQRAMFPDLEKGETKARSLALANKDNPLHTITSDEADAVCLALWARHTYS